MSNGLSSVNMLVSNTDAHLCNHEFVLVPGKVWHFSVAYEFEHWATLIRDVVMAKTVWAAITHVIRPPGWMPEDGGETTEELRRKSEAARRECEVTNS